MTANETRRYEMLTRVREFGQTCRACFEDSPQALRQFEIVATEVARMGEHAVGKMSSARQGVPQRAQARAALIERLTAISGTARALDPDVPGLGDRLRLPRARGEQVLITTGRLFAREAAPVASHFVAHGMPPDFITGLLALVERLERAIAVRLQEKSGHAAARARIGASMAAALDAVKRLDAFVGNRLQHDPVMLATWRHARHVRHARTSVAGVTTGEAPPPEAVADRVRG